MKLIETLLSLFFFFLKHWGIFFLHFLKNTLWCQKQCMTPMSRPAHGVKLSVSYWAGYALPSPSKHETSGSEVTSGVTCFTHSSQGQGIVPISNCTLMRSFKSHSKPVSCMSHPHFSVEKIEAHKARWPTWVYIASEWQSQNFNCNCQLPWRENVPSDAVPGFGVESISLQHKAHTRPHVWDPPPPFQPSSLCPPWYIPRSHPQVFLTDIKSCSGRGITQLRWLWSTRSRRPPPALDQMLSESCLCECPGME